MHDWVELLTAGWFFYLGAAVGSFSNVVAWRMPRGLAFGGSVSRCPNCGKAISFFDNVPILGWLNLRGRCRQCRWPIPIRYLLVEVAYGSMFVLLYYIDLRLPTWEGDSPWPWIDSPKDIGRLLYHAALLSLLGICCLIRSQGSSVPKRLWWFGVVVGVGGATMFSELHGIHWSMLGPVQGSPWRGFLDSFSAVALGGIYDMLFTRLNVQSSANEGKLAAPAREFSLAGAFLGFVPTIPVLLLTAIAVGLLPRGRLPLIWSTCALVFTVAVVSVAGLLSNRVEVLQALVPSWARFGVLLVAGIVYLLPRRQRTT